MKKSVRRGKALPTALKRTSRKTAAAPREAWAERLSWRAARARGAVVHAFAHARERAGDLGRRAVAARAQLVWRLKHGSSAPGLVQPALLSVAAASAVFLALGTLWSALAAAGWSFAIALLLALRSAQQRSEAAVQHELYELRQAVQHELWELRQQLQVTQALIQVEELEEEVEEVDLHDEPTRAAPAPKATRFGWARRFALSRSAPR